MNTAWKSALTTLLVCLLVSTALSGQEYPKATGYVNDYASLLSHDEGSLLNQELDAFERKTSVEIAVVIVSSLNGESIESYTKGLATAWGVGKRGKNNGVVFLIAPKEHKMRIETASGARETLTDARADEIRDEKVLPRFKAGNMQAGIIDGTHAIMRVFDPGFATATESVPAPQPSRSKEETDEQAAIVKYIVAGVVLVAGLLFFIVSLIRRRQAARYVLEKRERLLDRFVDLEETLRDADVKEDTRAKAANLIREFSPIKELTPSTKRVDWFKTRKLIDSADRSLRDITSTMREEVLFARQARRDGPQLMEKLPRMIRDAERKLARGDQNPNAERYLEEARLQFAKAQRQLAALEMADWLIVYTMLHSAESYLAKVESRHIGENAGPSSISPSAPDASSFGFGNSSGGFGGGGGFDSGGGGSSGSW